jgi:hypothetical protein
VAGTHYYTVNGQLATKREVQSHLNVKADGHRRGAMAHSATERQ